MKKFLSTIICVLLFVAMVAGAVCSGAVRGWSGERDRVLDALLSPQQKERAMDAANLATVAARHLPADDADVLALRDAYQVITSDAPADDAAVRADAAITAASASLAQRLPQLASYQASSRDKAYVTTLTRTLSDATATDNARSFAASAADFNQRLQSSPTGMLAMLLGVKPLQGLE